jgi:SAM-dependent methyltransferase
MITQTTKKVCNICGGTEFNNEFRTSRSGIPPQCASCGSLERIRIIRKIYNKIPHYFLKQRKALQFSNDYSANREAFASFEVSIYGGENSLDMMSIDRPDASYDWIISNQVLEHVPDDVVAVKELLRILKPNGVIHINVPSPAYALETEDWGYPDPKLHDHYRGYGSDFLLHIEKALTDCYAIQVIEIDDVTQTRDIVYFIGKSYDVIRMLGLHLLKEDCIVIRGK